MGRREKIKIKKKKDKKRNKRLNREVKFQIPSFIHQKVPITIMKQK